MDTAICGEPRWVLAGQLPYGDSLHCSTFLPTSVQSSVSAATRNMLFFLPNGTTLTPTREAGLVLAKLPEPELPHDFF